MTAPVPLDAARAVFAGREAWIVGGAVRDRLLGRATTDLDLSLPEDPRDAARALASRAGGAAFRLSGAFGAWRVVGPDHAWHVDLVTLRDGDIRADLASRDFTINAMAEPLAGGELLDPHGGRADLDARRLRMVGGAALADDPLRTLRAVRIAIDLELAIEPGTAAAIGRAAPGLGQVAAERVFGELKHVIRSPAVRTGLQLMEAHGITAQVLPELLALRGVEQNEYHHLDVHDHTLEVLDQVSVIERDPVAAGFGEHAEAVGALLREPLADELTRGHAMRLAALLHDAAKPWTRMQRGDGRVGFPGHDRDGAGVARAVLRRLRASERLTSHVAALCLHHLRLGFLVHERPLDRRAVWRYLRATEPYAAEVTVFTVADRLATRGRNAEPAIAAHVELAREVLGAVLACRAEGPRPPLVRGDELARELGVRPGRRLGELLAQLDEDRFAGAIATRASWRREPVLSDEPSLPLAPGYTLARCDRCSQEARMRSTGHGRRHVSRRVTRGVLAASLATLCLAATADARTLVSVTFDDGSSDQYAVRSLLADRGMRATFYVNSGEVGTSSYYMSWSQLQQLYADGHEIGGHTLHHTDSDTQSLEQQRHDVCQDRSNLLQNGFAVTSFAYAFGRNGSAQAVTQGCGYNTGQLAGGLRWGSSCLGCAVAEHLPPRRPYALRTVEIRAGNTGQQLAGYVEEVRARGGGWVIFPFNRVCDDCGRYAVSPVALRDFLDRVAAMVAAGEVDVSTVQQVVGGRLQPVPGASPGTVLPPPPPSSGVTVAERDTIRPIILRLSASSRRFALARGKTPLTAAARRGVTFRYSVSEPARVKFRVQRAASGRRAGRVCRRPVARLRTASRCRRYVTVGSFDRTSERLVNRVRFTGRLGTKALRPGRHRVVVRAIDTAGNRSRKRSVDLTVVARRSP